MRFITDDEGRLVLQGAPANEAAIICYEENPPAIADGATTMGSAAWEYLEFYWTNTLTELNPDCYWIQGGFYQTEPDGTVFFHTVSSTVVIPNNLKAVASSSEVEIVRLAGQGLPSGVELLASFTTNSGMEVYVWWAAPICDRQDEKDVTKVRIGLEVDKGVKPYAFGSTGKNFHVYWPPGKSARVELSVSDANGTTVSESVALPALCR